MMTRSIVSRFLILAVFLVSLGVIAQAAFRITQGPSKVVAKAGAAPLATPAAAGASAAIASAAIASASPAPAAPQAADAPAQQGAQQAADAAPVRVVYPGPLGDTPVQPRKFAAAAPAVPTVPQPAAAQPVAPVAQATAPAVEAPAASTSAAPAAPAPAKPSPVVVASADPDTQPAADPAASPAGKGGVNLNSASVDALNHLGGGHIGQTIVKHRPYGSVEDLVKKRVVRRSVYEHIKDQLAAQ